MRHLLFVTMSALLLIPAAPARELTELRDRVRDGVSRTDKDLSKIIHRDKLDAQQRERFDSVIKDFEDLAEAVKSSKWEGERDRLERAADNIDAILSHAPIEDADKQTLGIDVYTLRVILDSWKK